MKRDHFRPLFILGVCIGVFLALDGCRAKDSTDPPDGRSGMGLRIDHMTGCHYLTTVSLLGETSITPRLRADGTQVCNGEKN